MSSEVSSPGAADRRRMLRKNVDCMSTSFRHPVSPKGRGPGVTVGGSTVLVLSPVEREPRAHLVEEDG